MKKSTTTFLIFSLLFAGLVLGDPFGGDTPSNQLLSKIIRVPPDLLGLGRIDPQDPFAEPAVIRSAIPMREFLENQVGDLPEGSKLFYDLDTRSLYIHSTKEVHQRIINLVKTTPVMLRCIFRIDHSDAVAIGVDLPKEPVIFGSVSIASAQTSVVDLDLEDLGQTRLRINLTFGADGECFRGTVSGKPAKAPEEPTDMRLVFRSVVDGAFGDPLTVYTYKAKSGKLVHLTILVAEVMQRRVDLDGQWLPPTRH